MPEANVHPDDVQGLSLIERLQSLQKEFAPTADSEKGRQWTATFDELRRLVESHSVLTDDERTFLRDELRTPAYSLVPRSTESIPKDQRPAVGEICLSAAVPEPPPEMMIPAPQLGKVSEIDEQPKLRIGHFQYPDLSRVEAFFAGRTVLKATDEHSDGGPDGPPETGKQPKKPSLAAWQTWHFSRRTGETDQTELARRMTEGGIEMSQPTVSRHLAAVNAYMDAGSAEMTLQDVAAQARGNTLSMDPNVLEFGPRTDKHTES